VDAAERAELPAQRLERLAVDQEDLEILLVTRDPDRAVAVARVEVLEPGVGRLEDVAVGVDNRAHRPAGTSKPKKRAAFRPRMFARAATERWPIVRSIASAECGHVPS